MPRLRKPLALAGAMAVALAGAGTSGGHVVRPTAGALLQIVRAPEDPAFVTNDGGGIVTSVESGFASPRLTRSARLDCRFDSVDRTNRTPFQSDPQGTCAVYFPAGHRITLTARPDFRSRVMGWHSHIARYPSIVSPKCERIVDEVGCTAFGPRVTVVPDATGNVLFVDFALRTFVLTVVNKQPGFGEAEDHDVGAGQKRIDCGHGHQDCWARYEYGTRPVLDALWDTRRKLKVVWEGCDRVNPARSNAALCAVTMTRNRRVTVSWP